MKESRIFIKRILKSYKEKGRVLKVIGDWTIWLYLLIPFSIIATIQYIRWLEEPPAIVNDISVFFIWFLFYCIAWVGQIRPFIEEPDPVFLMKRPTSFLKLKKYALVYGLFVHTVGLIIFSIIAYPVLIKPFGIIENEFLVFILFWVVMKWLLLAIKLKINGTNSLLNKTIYFLLFLVGIGIVYIIHLISIYEPFLWIIIIASIALVSLFIHIRYANSIYTFRQDLIVEQRERTKLAMRTFMLAKEIEKPKIIRRKKPIILERGETPLFKKRTPVNGFLELFIKISIRNGSYVSSYIQLTLYTCFAFVMLPSLIIKIIVFIGFIFMMLFWLNQLTETIIKKSRIGEKYRENIHYLIAEQKFSRLLTGVSVGITLIFFILTIHDPLSGIRSLLFRY